ncbi:MAG: hypothetical protein ACYDAQ_13795 [Mycobacteriales bacterium]
MGRIGRAGLVLFSASALAPATSSVGWAADGAGFRYGTDSNQPTVTSSGPPYTNTFHDYATGTNTSLGGIYGGYLGRLTSSFTVNGCGGDQQNNTTNVSDANANFSAGYGQGAAEILYFGGPAIDPNYDPSAPSGAEAYAWGAKQGDAAIVVWQQSSFAAILRGAPEDREGWNSNLIRGGNTARSAAGSSITYGEGRVIDGTPRSTDTLPQRFPTPRCPILQACN